MVYFFPDHDECARQYVVFCDGQPIEHPLLADEELGVVYTLTHLADAPSAAGTVTLSFKKYTGVVRVVPKVLAGSFG